MEHHILARFAQVILILYASIVASPMFGCLTIYFYLFGWFINEDESNKWMGSISTWSPKLIFNFAMMNIVIQLIIGSVFIGFSWGIFVMMIFSLGLFFGIFSTKEHIEKAQKFISTRFRRIGRVW